MRPPRTGRRWIRSRVRPATGWPARGGRSWRAATATEVRWAVDLTGSAAALLLAVLVAAGQQVAYVPGRMVNRMAGMFRGEGKTDAKDARLIAETARMCPHLAVVNAREELVAELTRPDRPPHRLDGRLGPRRQPAA